MTAVPDLSGNTGGVDPEFAPERDGTPNYPYSVLAAFSAGSAVIGKVGIDQTTPGTTNAVVATGNVANNAADSGNGVKVSGVYSTASTLTSISAGNRADLQSDARGNLRVIGAGIAISPGVTGTQYAMMLSSVSATLSAPTVMPLAVGGFLWNGTNTIPQPGDASGTISQPYALATNRWSYAGAAGGIVSSTSGVTIAAAAGAGVRNYLSSIELEHDTLSAVTEFVIRDGAAGTVLWRGKLQTTATEGGARKFDPPLKGSANTLMEIAALTSVTGGIYFNGHGYIAA